MQKIGILSDTHGCWDDKYAGYFSGCDEIWHAGDIGSEEVLSRLEAVKPVRAVYGNIDGHIIRSLCPEILRFKIEDVEVLLTHIGGYPGKYGPKIRKEIYASPVQLFVCGHSHILKVMYDKGLQMLCVNPGAAGWYGFHNVRTLVRLVIDGDKIKDLEVIELGTQNLKI
ncbi:MAG: metallophosphatase family protein [Dysgonamonadaceae bacterium]|jgi:putative phosphoesterase|nr:metallophosphatase family protein [Dysgonamonadaceae bacterium]